MQRQHLFTLRDPHKTAIPSRLSSLWTSIRRGGSLGRVEARQADRKAKPRKELDPRARGQLLRKAGQTRIIP